MDKIVGIIAEYNPFHNGHAYQIRKAKELTQAKYALILMSGDFVQRGTPAAFDKYARTHMALLGGADAVLELPTVYACSSAEFFAKGAVSILELLGCIDFLSFGSESGKISPCLSLADILLKEPPEYKTSLKELLKKGTSFPTARKYALENYAKIHDLPEMEKDFLDLPNNILGIEYCKALLSINSKILPVPVKREGSGYHETDITHPLSSASAIRNLLHQGEYSFQELQNLLAYTLPAQTSLYFSRLLKEEKPMHENYFSMLLKYGLMLKNPEAISEYSDVSLDLSRRIYRLLNEFSSFSQFVRILKTKEITHTRIQRALLHILLEIEEKMPSKPPTYVRVLGFRKDSSSLLRTLHENSRIPVITKAADYKKLLPKSAIPSFQKDLFAADLYESVKAQNNRKEFTSDLRKPPVIIF